MAGFVHWTPNALLNAVNRVIDSKMRQMGEVGVAEARRLVPVLTGQLRDSIGVTYRQSDKTVTLYADKYYAIMVEAGTMRMAARPFLRPALAKMAQVWGSGAVNLELATPMTATRYAPGYRQFVGSHVTVRKGGFLRKARRARVLIGHHGHTNPRAGPL